VNPGGDQPPTFIHSTDSGTTHVQLRPEGAKEIEPLSKDTVASLWQQVPQMTDLEGDVYLAALVQALATPPDEEGYTWLTCQHILDYRGVQPIMKHEGAVTRTAGHRQEDIAAVSKAFRRAASIWINIRQWIGEETGTGKRKKRKKVLYTMSCNVIQIGRTIRQDELAPPPDINDPPRMPGVTVAYGYRIDPGILRLLTPPNRQVALLHQKSLRYDPYHQQWEKRLSRYFMFHLRIAAGHGSASIKRNPGALIGELSLPINRDEPQRTRERFEKAKNRFPDNLPRSQALSAHRLSHINWRGIMNSSFFVLFLYAIL
jgi:hypothetical protein